MWLRPKIIHSEYISSSYIYYSSSVFAFGNASVREMMCNVRNLFYLTFYQHAKCDKVSSELESSIIIQ